MPLFSSKNPDTAKLAQVKALVLDVDGVLTKGEIIYDGAGREAKVFSVRDGLGLRLLLQNGFAVGIVTGRMGPALSARMKNLQIRLVWDNVSNKAAVLPDLVQAFGCQPENMAFVGDDLPDLPLMALVGLPIAVADAHPQVLAAASMTTAAPGGAGAVREVCEAILAAHGLWEKILNGYRTGK
jgi:3-deoxy-D-manno-octulosonate 8-phosphate phosphatase (KDO 8-P phosphatase)